ncbi:OLC1v1019850C1 [Oldenlandia corymbosa var. corymbosa]|uniref:OLC1v1019850C1 n=1 Tax=Oldenlandia corymbosa var. corymbosa TaxID=529605 RepID=A0AAV1EF46_OLDCO|nr:OLC1v1019850C1 [Oldenlandia corymbosa var. corymbosa]
MRENTKRQILDYERTIELHTTMKDHNEASNKKGNEKRIASFVEEDSREDALGIEMVVEAAEMEAQEIVSTGEDNLVINEQTDNEGTRTSIIRVPFPTETRKKKKKKKRSFTSVVASTRERIRSTGGRRKNSARNVGAFHPRKTRKSSAVVVTADSSNDDEYIPRIGYQRRTRNSRIKDPDYSHPREELKIKPLIEPVDDLTDSASNFDLGTNGVAIEESELATPTRRSYVAYRGSRKRKRGRGHPKKKDGQEVIEEDLMNNNINESSEKQKRMLVEDLNIPSHLVVDSEEVLRQDPPIWFQLVASNPKENRATLPPYYIQVKDVTMPASCIKKYLVLKLGLQNEDELEIKMRGAPVHPETELQELVRLWVQTATGSDMERSCVVGSPGEDLVMVFAYSWRPGSSIY